MLIISILIDIVLNLILVVKL